MKALTILMMASVATPCVAWASDWRYCYASSDMDRRFYTSQPFAASKGLETLEDELRSWLDERSIRHDSLGCPRGSDRQSVESSIRSAAAYNERNGRATSRIDWVP